MTPHVFIISWTGQHANSQAIAHALRPGADKLTLVYSDRDEALVLDPPCQAIRTPDDWYWGMKFKTCLDACTSDRMLVIHGDASCDDWPGLLGKCQDSLDKIDKIGVWAPRIDYTPFDLGKTLIAKLDRTSLNIVAQTDGIVFALARPVVARMRTLAYQANKYGWGIVWAALAYSYANRMIAVVDDSLLVRHPRERGYDDRAAQQQMNVFLRQLDLDETLQYRLLDSHIKRLAAEQRRRLAANAPQPVPGRRSEPPQ